MDGGTVWDVNIPSVIDQCKSMGVTDQSKIIIDVSICGNGKEGSFVPTKNAAENFLHSYNLHKSYHSMNSI